MSVPVQLSEEERQAVILALAMLAVERPGWDAFLNEIASRMDNVVNGRAQMYDGFKIVASRHGPGWTG